MKKDFGCDKHEWVGINHNLDAQCLVCGLTSWNSLTYKKSEMITREEFKKLHEKS